MIFRRRESALQREIEEHVQSLADAYVRQGDTPQEARRKALRDFGPIELIKDNTRDEQRANWLATAAQDLRFGVRMLRQAPGFTAAAVVTLALAIGATSTILSFADVILWRQLAVPAPQQLDELWWNSRQRVENLYKSSSGSGFRENGIDHHDYFGREGWQALQQRTHGKAQIAAHIYPGEVSVANGRTVVVSRARGVSGNFFQMLQARPFAGRLLGPNDDLPQSTPAAVLTHALWQSQFPGQTWNPQLTLRINGIVYAVAGVLPPDFTGLLPGDETGLYTTIYQSPEMLGPDSWLALSHGKPTTWFLQLMLRRGPGVTREQLQPLLQDAFTTINKTEAARIVVNPAATGLGNIRRQFANPVQVLGVLVTLVLLIACANIANLLLARAAEREREAALRLSLGCSAGRLMRQFFTESLLLAGLGGLLSVGVVYALGRMLTTLLPVEIEPGVRTLAGTAAITLLTALVFGLWPARRAASADVAQVSREGSGTAGTASRARWRVSRALVMAQVGFGVLLVGAATVYTAQLQELVNRDTGFQRANMLLFDVRPGELGYVKDKLRPFYQTLIERLRQLPGVDAASLARTRPMRGGGYYDEIATMSKDKRAQSAIHHITADFDRSLGLPLAAGRWISRAELDSGAKVGIISEDLVKALGLANPLGLRLRTYDGEAFDVIGIARHASYSNMARDTGVTYLPFDFQRTSATVVLRTKTPPLALVPGARQVLDGLNRDLPMVDIFTMEQQISRTLQRERMFAWLCGCFGALALVLTAVGLYGLLSHMTARRTPEIGIRMALGATRANVLRQVFSEGLRLAAFGLVAGLPLAWRAAVWAEEKKLWPKTIDLAPTLGAASAVLALVAILAALIPALRASALDPMKALRHG